MMTIMSGVLWRCSKTDSFMRKAFLFVALISMGMLVAAQDADMAVADSSGAAKGRVIPMTGAFLQPLQERDSVLIADQLLYGFELKRIEEGTVLALPEWKNDGKDGVQVVGGWTVDTVAISKKKKGMPRLLDIRGSIVVTSFDEGIYELPSIAVGRVNSEGGLDTLVFDPLKLEVKTMPVDTAVFVPHDIKGQIRYPVTFSEVLPWILLSLLGVAIVILAVYLIRKYGRGRSEQSVRQEPAHIVALRKLDRYRGNRMWAPQQQKMFYSGVTDVLREYMEARYGISAMEMTTAEIFSEMKSVDLSEAMLADLKELFERADFVKFAKFVASDEDNASVVPLAVRFVTDTYQSELEKEEKEGGNE